MSALTAWNVAYPVALGVDVATGCLLWWVIGRPHWLLPVFIAEAIPGIGTFPCWTLVVGTLAVTGRLPMRGVKPSSPTTEQISPTPSTPTDPVRPQSE
ncbi:MAG: hypothetical protein EXS15_00280 [Phycisphaerales bacterium]|nr:hypothetical protein [Phycisphaerales bacterium]